MTVTEPARSVRLIETPFVEHGQPVRLKLVVYTPPTPGPHPVVVFNHGSTGRGNHPALYAHLADYPRTARFFSQRGWMLVAPQRRGRGGSDGVYGEGFGADRSSGYSCDPATALAGLDRATQDVGAVLEHLDQQPDVDMRRLLIGGVSRGGVLAIACAGRWPDRFVGALNFNGGWLGRACATHEQVNPQAFARGTPFRGPTLWLHGSHDPYYRIAHCRAHFAAYLAAGGRGSFHSLRGGHGLIAQPALWQPLVGAWLDGELPHG